MGNEWAGLDIVTDTEEEEEQQWSRWHVVQPNSLGGGLDLEMSDEPPTITLSVPNCDGGML